MDTDKALGAWFGLAVGDALGQAVRGLKPEAIRQIFKSCDTYLDVRPVIGRGIKHYRMQGLYGTSMQMALALAESMAAHKKFNADEFADLLIRFSVGGPESYFGAFRRPEACWVRTLQDLPSRAYVEAPTLTTDFGSYFPLGLTVALFYGKDSITCRDAWGRTVGMFTDHPTEISGTALTGWLVQQLADLPEDRFQSMEGVETFLAQAATWTFDFEKDLQARQQGPEGVPAHALSELIHQLSESWSDLSGETLETWVVENANRSLKQPVHHASQGKTLTLLPLALSWVMDSEKTLANLVTHAASRGREAVKLAGLTGLLAGARFGFSSIPAHFQNGLVNFREVKERGDALVRRRVLKGKDPIAMELGLTQKEAEEKKKYLPKEMVKKPKAAQSTRLEDLFSDMEGEEEDPLSQIREDPWLWRKFQRDKSKKKKERRQKPPAQE